MITPDLLKRLCHARERLQSELEPSPRVSALAREAGLSTAHFICQFGALFGQTPLQCRTRARLERAREALHASGESTTQVGLALGFDNPGSLSRVFTRHVGVPPRTWRKMARPVAAPAGCIALMNQALAADRDFGEVGPADPVHDGGTRHD